MHESRFEKEVRLLLEEIGIDYQERVWEGGYEMDFVVGDRINIEVDGPFHDTHKHHIKDMLRDKALTEKGYQIYRMKMYVGVKKRAQLKNEKALQILEQFLAKIRISS